MKSRLSVTSSRFSQSNPLSRAAIGKCDRDRHPLLSSPLSRVLMVSLG